MLPNTVRIINNVLKVQVPVVKALLGALGVSAVKSFYPCTDSKNGCSNASATQRKNRAASAPSINR